MAIYGDMEAVILENRLKAFKHYVTAWKKQDSGTVRVDGDIYIYTTKRGVEKRFKATNRVTSLKVNGFYFEPIICGDNGGV